MTKLLKRTSWIFALAGLLLMGSLLAGCDEEDNNNGGNNAGVSILARGGAGDNGPGGLGGVVVVIAAFPGAILDVLPGGEADARFVTPGSSPVNLGPEPWVVGRDTTVLIYLNQADANANADNGEYLLLLGDSNLYRKEGVGDYTVISGLKVLEGAVLTLGLNVDAAGQPGEDLVVLSFSDDVVIDGVLQPMSLDTGNLGGAVELRDGAPATDRDMGALEIGCLNFSLKGKIDTAGKNATVAGDRGGFGAGIAIVVFGEARLAGRIDLSGGNGRLGGDGGEAAWGAASPSGLVVQSTMGSIVNRADLLASGGDGEEGGNGGPITLDAPGDVVSFGAVRADGGDGENGDGGSASVYFLTSNVNSVHNLGNISLRGGDAVEDGVGGPVMAGNGGQVQFTAAIDASNSGLIDISGGDAFVDGIGGGAGGFVTQLAGPAGLLVNRAQVLAMGGESQGLGHTGGTGGTVVFNAPAASARIKGRINVSGGPGDTGGPAGSVTVFGGAEARLLGYDGRLLVDGGDGSMGGGGGQVQLIDPSGDLTNKVPISGNAGRSDLGAGPSGGVYAVAARFADLQGRVSLQGSDADGGNGSPGGQVIITTLLDLDFQGEVRIQGGNAGGAGNAGGGPGGGILLNGRNVNEKGVVSGSGGQAVGTGAGGPGGTVTVVATDHVKSRTDYLVGGGKGDMTVGFGGVGGLIVLDSNVVTPTDYHGHFNAAGGEASVPGPDGTFTIDTVVVWP